MNPGMNRPNTDEKVEVELFADESAFDQLALRLYKEHDIDPLVLYNEAQMARDRILFDIILGEWENGRP